MTGIIELIDEYGRSSYEAGASDANPLYDPGRHYKHEQRDSDKFDLLAAVDALRTALTARDEQIAAALRLLREGDDDDQTRIGAVRILAGSATA